MYKDPIKDVSRWRIRGTVTAQSRLHVGDGGWSELSERKCHKPAGSGNPEYATVFTDHRGQPMIPATSLRGVLRSWAKAHGQGEAADRVFGGEDRGGLVRFHDAPLSEPAKPVKPEQRYWCAERGTELTPHVVMDPHTRTAKERLLYFTEYVPAGSVFEITLSGQNTDGNADEARRLLLYLLENAFASTERPARVGSETANGWGCVAWKRSKVEAMDLESIRSWLNEAKPRPWHEAMELVKNPDGEEWTAPAGVYVPKCEARLVRIGLTLQFTGGMLVNDPTQEREMGPNQTPVSHAMLRNVDDKVVLPAQSVRGAFRAQARRIWQTLAWGGYAYLERTDQVCRRNGEQGRLPGFLRLFGAGGWQSPIQLEDFLLPLGVKPKDLNQEFVAVDRFTGGAANQKKFRACGLWQPKFKGEMRIRVDRWRKAKVGDWCWLMLAFTLRDWVEGDGVAGFGASKGYGAFKAGVEIGGEGEEAGLLAGVVGRDLAVLRDARLEEWEASLRGVLG